MLSHRARGGGGTQSFHKQSMENLWQVILQFAESRSAVTVTQILHSAEKNVKKGILVLKVWIR